jgi:hypothetical protein
MIGNHLAVSPRMDDYKNDDLLSVNCGRCGNSLTVRLEDIRDLRTIDCEACGNALPTREGATRSPSAAISVAPHQSQHSENVPWRMGFWRHERTDHVAVSPEEQMAIIDSAPDTVTVRISLSNDDHPTGRVADAELHFVGGPLAGLKLVGFAIWNRRGGGYQVTFPARQYSTDGQRRSFTLLRDIPGRSGSQAVRDLILEAFTAALAARLE